MIKPQSCTIPVMKSMTGADASAIAIACLAVTCDLYEVKSNHLEVGFLLSTLRPVSQSQHELLIVSFQ